MSHEHYTKVRVTMMVGAFQLGMLQGVVNEGQWAKRRLTRGGGSLGEVEEDLECIRDAGRAKEEMEGILESSGYYDGPDGPRLREMRNRSFDEVLKGDVDVEVFAVDGCPTCLELAGKISDVCRTMDFRMSVTPVEESSVTRWVFDLWPHIEVGGHEVSTKMLEDLVIDARWIRSTNRQGSAGDD